MSPITQALHASATAGVPTRHTCVGPMPADENGVDRMDVLLQAALATVKNRDAEIERLYGRARVERAGHEYAAAHSALADALRSTETYDASGKYLGFVTVEARVRFNRARADYLKQFRVSDEEETDYGNEDEGDPP